MRTISLCLVAMMFLASCGKNIKYDQSQYNIQFLYNPWINLDFNTGIVEVSVAKYRDTIRIAEKDKKLIMDSFKDNGIGSLEGDIFVDSKQTMMPPNNFQFKVIKRHKSLSDITVSNTDPVTDGENRRILNFKKTVVDVLNRNSDFKAAKQAFAKSGVVIY